MNNAIPQTKLPCSFETKIHGELYQITAAWLNSDEEIILYEGHTFREGVKFERPVLPTEMKSPLK